MGDRERTAFNLDRDRGILTPEDRKFLLGETDYEHQQSARRRRSIIRNRVENALLDFEILRYLEERDRDQIFDSADTDGGAASGFASAYIFLYDALVRYQDDYQHVDLNLYAYLEQAIQAGDFRRGYRTEVEMSINREELDDPAEIFRRAKEEGLQSLTWLELEYVWESDEVNAGEFAKLLNQLFPSEDVDSQDIRYERRKLGQAAEDPEKQE